MEKPNIVEFKVTGRRALFSDPTTKMGGEKFSYQIPTYQALKGILESVYWKPTFTWVIDEVRVMNSIQTQSEGMRPIEYGGGNTLAIYTYLSNVEYQVRAHFIWNKHRPELAKDQNKNKHHCIAKRMIERGGRRDIFLGTRECQGYVEPCAFGEGKGDYDELPELSFGLMFHGFDYPDETGSEVFAARLWKPVMKKGIITFDPPERCKTKRELRQMKAKSFGPGNFIGLDEFEGEGWFCELDGQTLSDL